MNIFLALHRSAKIKQVFQVTISQHTDSLVPNVNAFLALAPNFCTAVRSQDFRFVTFLVENKRFFFNVRHQCLAMNEVATLVLQGNQSTCHFFKPENFCPLNFYRIRDESQLFYLLNKINFVTK